MRRNIDLPEILWDTMTTLADDMGYSSRQALIEEVIRVFTNQYPDAKVRSMDVSAKRLARLKDKQDFMELENTARFKKASSEEIMELWAEEDVPRMPTDEQLNKAMVVVKEYEADMKDVVDQSMDDIVVKGWAEVHVPHGPLPETPELPDL